MKRHLKRHLHPEIPNEPAAAQTGSGATLSLPAGAAVFIVLLLTATATFAATPAVRVTADLKPSHIHVQMLRDGVLTYFDSNRHLKVEMLGETVQLRFGDPKRKTEEPAGLIELIDGQALVGTLAGADPDGQQLHWQHPYLGQVTVPLEQVAAMSLRGPLTPRTQKPGDQLTLANGDVVEGFIEAITPDGVRLKPDGGDSILLPMDNVVQIDLANPPRDTAGHHRIWLDDQTRLRVGDLSIINGRVNLIDPVLTMVGPVDISVDRLRRIDINAPGRQLVDLASLPFTVESGGQVFGVTSLPAIENDVLRLHAPITVRFDLPDGAVRFAAVLELDEDETFTAGTLAWADFRVIVRAGDQQLAEHRISDSQRTAAVHLDLPAATLSIELDPAANGPIMDRLRITNAMLLLTEQPASR